MIPIKRFMSHVQKTETCWIWTANKIHNGYGRVRVGPKLKLAHRVSYELHVGPIPLDKLCCHKCDVRDCVNPEHLYIGTKKTNSQDMYDRNRTPRKKITKDQVQQMRDLLSAGFSRHDLASKFDLSYSHTVSILNHSRHKT